MSDVDTFVKAGRAARRSYASAPETQFDFGPYSVSSQVTIRTGLPRQGVAGGKCRLNVTDPASGSSIVCEFERVGMPLGFELMHGIAGNVDGEPFVVRRTRGPRLLRRDRTVDVSGAVGLSVGYEYRQSAIRSDDDPGRLLWTSSSGGLLSLDASHREAAVICVLVVNAVDQSSSLRRFLHFL
ncbi:MAG: hypothetical protein M3003_16370 [Candidatus Dormibacteraeota bacterium]|nr:hypothetical protein [Candidatus Dormibacteraeota bacterium]